jgi:hypothetical protein
MNPFHPPEVATGSTPLVISSPGDLIAAIPYLLGFHPELSLVVVGIDGHDGTCVLRTDLPQLGETAMLEEMGRRIAEITVRNGFTAVHLVGYGPRDRTAPAIYVLGDALLSRSVSLGEAIQVDLGRWWSFTCEDPCCCPPEGRPYDISATLVAAQAVLCGQVALADRSALVASVAPLDGGPREAVRLATDRAERRWLNQASDTPNPAAVRVKMIRDGLRLVAELTRRARTDAGLATDDEIALLGILLTVLRVRDEAWVRIGEPHLSADLAFWRDVVRRVQGPYAAAPASLLAYAALLAGDGGLANVALDRAFESDPEYSMACLLRDVIAVGIPPSKVRISMTPEELAAAYEKQEQRVQPSTNDQSEEAGR